jgi:hypothetical protein
LGRVTGHALLALALLWPIDPVTGLGLALTLWLAAVAIPTTPCRVDTRRATTIN